MRPLEVVHERADAELYAFGARLMRLVKVVRAILATSTGLLRTADAPAAEDIEPRMS